MSAIGGQCGAHSESTVGPTVEARPSLPGAPRTFQHEKESGFIAKEFLGQGTFGKVYGGTIGQNNEAVALKLLPRDPIGQDQGVDKEITALKCLAHPCIVRLHGVIFTTFNAQLLLQRHEMSLAQYLQRQPVEAKAKQIAQSVLRGLAYMHAAGYVHRDLKPANILVDSQPLAAVISDLGSTHLGEGSRDLVTTMTSRAPEIMLRHPYGKASDVWSLGCTLAELEQQDFFYQLPCASSTFSRRAQEYRFMRGLATKLCPVSLLALKSLGSIHTGVGKEVIELGAVCQGVVGVRFHSLEFHAFIAKMLHFQKKARATAQDLLKHPWPQP
jgi:serine/threonine protein kinase